MVKKRSRIAVVLTHFALAAALLTAASCSLLSPRDYDQYRLSESSALDGGRDSEGCPGATEQPCGNCGTQVRTCDGAGWSAWASCSGEGTCAPNGVVPCASSSTPSWSQVCSSSCNWQACNPDQTALARVTLADGSGTFAIEQHEVTRKQYQQFLEAPAADVALAVGTPPPGCSTVSNFPDATCLADPSVCASNCDRHPQVCVHWCGAYAYCKWLGRRLCGKIGGGSTDATQSRSPQISQWTAACVGTQGSADVFPYGAIPVPRRCNDLSSGISTVEVAQKRDCHGGSVPFDSIYDLSGNVAEWGDSCVVVDPANQTVRCQTRGGSFNDDPDSSETGPSLRCAGSILDWTDMFSCLPYVGFRCCMD